MKKPNHFFEIHDNLTQFIAALDDVIIQRYNKERNSESAIEVRYVLAPKHRVLHDIVNKSDNITLPVAAIEVASVSRAKDRVFNKLYDTPISQQLSEKPFSSVNYPSPIPIDISVNVTFIAKYMNDIDQIISNIFPNCNPYFIISWKVPEQYGLEYDQEIRTEVLWDGDLSYDSPIQLTHSDKYRITISTSFTIKGWLFKDSPGVQGNIFKIDTNFYTVSSKSSLQGINDYYNLSESYDSSDHNYTDVITISAHPTIEELKILYDNIYLNVGTNSNTTIDSSRNNTFIVGGNGVEYSSSFYLSSSTTDFYTDFTEISANTSVYPVISAYKIHADNITIINNVAVINIPRESLPIGSEFNLIMSNDAGWYSSLNYSGYNFITE